MSYYISAVDGKAFYNIDNLFMFTITPNYYRGDDALGSCNYAADIGFTFQ